MSTNGLHRLTKELSSSHTCSRHWTTCSRQVLGKTWWGISLLQSLPFGCLHSHKTALFWRSSLQANNITPTGVSSCSLKICGLTKNLGGVSSSIAHWGNQQIKQGTRMQGIQVYARRSPVLWLHPFWLRMLLVKHWSPLFCFSRLYDLGSVGYYP